VLADGGDVAQGPEDVEPLLERGIVELDQRDDRLRDRRGVGQRLAPLRLAHWIRGQELVPDDAFHPPRAAVTEVVVEQVGVRQRGVVPDERLERLVATLEEPMAIRGVIEEVDVRVDDLATSIGLAHRNAGLPAIERSYATG
jgi:hypothetical protein